jgi:hypothetical protein
MNIPFPSSIPAQLSWGFRRNIVINESLNGTLTRIGRTGDRWECSMALPLLVGDSARLMRSFAMRVSAPDNYGLLPCNHGYEFSGSAGLTPLVNGASQSGSVLNIDGLPNGVTGIIKAGDRLGLTTLQVLEAAADVNSNGSGEAAVPLVYPLRASPADNSAVNLYNPVGRFIMPEAFVQWALSPPLLHSFTFQFVEAI